eukprot:TRINITY_DN17081_c0_g1_i1.p1 TRINITY_DN17081_c0_g1~~TRINITY_DN17081_c0_g1_i1.p1  ORF type:complete len:1109 (-),score=156.85 TRINITY_DN17081_c0_g1_i1:134-3280(-)
MAGSRSSVQGVGDRLAVVSDSACKKKTIPVLQSIAPCLLQVSNVQVTSRKPRQALASDLVTNSNEQMELKRLTQISLVATDGMGGVASALAPTPVPTPAVHDDIETVLLSLTPALTSQYPQVVKATQSAVVLSCDEVCLWEPVPHAPTGQSVPFMIQSSAVDVSNHTGGPSETNSNEIPESRQGAYFRPVSVTMYCVMWLTIQTLVVHTGLAIARNLDEFSGKLEPSKLTLTLSIASRGTPLAPVMCMLFVANRLRVLAVTNGLGEPSWSVKVSMIAATVGMAGQLCVVLFIGRYASATDSLQRLVDAASGEIGSGGYKAHVRFDQELFVNSKGTQRLTFVSQLVFMGCLYGGIVGVGALGSLYHGKEGQARVPLSAAVWSSALMSLSYFLAEFGLWAAATREDAVSSPKTMVKDEQRDAVQELGGACCLPLSKSSNDNSDFIGLTEDAESTTPDRLVASLTVVSSAVEKAPMLAVLFLTARMRHLQVNPPTGAPPRSVEIAFTVTALALALEIAASAYIGATGKEDVGYYRTKVYRATRFAHALQHSSAAAVYISVGVVAVSLRNGWSSSVPLSPTMVGVMSLCSVYFTVHIVLLVGSIGRDIFNKASIVLQNTLLAARISLNVCPILCVLFVGCRMRALQITQQKGAPQWWEQDCIHLCVCAVFVQFVCCLALPIFSGAATSVDPDGNAVHDLRPLIGAYAVTMVKYVALLCLHGGVIGICLAVFTMTPETALPSKPEAHSFFKAVVKAGVCTLVAVAISTILSSGKVIGLAVKLAIESVDEMFLGINITVGKVAIGLCSGFVHIGELIAHNPEDKGFASPHLLRAGKMVVKINIRKLFKSFGKHFEIEEVILENIELNFEKGSFDRPSNVKTVMNFMEGSNPVDTEDAASTSTPEVAQTSRDLDISNQTLPNVAKETESSAELVLKHVKITGIGVNVVLTAIGTVACVKLGDLDIPDLTKRMSSGGGVSTIVMIVMKTLLKTVMSNAAIIGTLASHGAKNAFRAVGGGALRVMAKTCGSSRVPKRARPLAASRPDRANGGGKSRA